MLPIITEIPTLDSFNQLLRNNPGVIIIKFGATWCGPCKMIENDVKNMFSIMPDNVQCVAIDIDQSLEFYSFMKKNRVLNGVPVIISYNKNNLSLVPDDYVVGASKEKIEAFSTRCLRLSKYTKGIPSQKPINTMPQQSVVLPSPPLQPQEVIQKPEQQPQQHQDDFNSNSNFDDF